MDREPTADDLAAIEAEWPQIAADLADLDAEIAALLDQPPAAHQPTELDRRRERRATRRALSRSLTELREVA